MTLFPERAFIYIDEANMSLLIIMIIRNCRIKVTWYKSIRDISYKEYSRLSISQSILLYRISSAIRRTEFFSSKTFPKI